MEHKHAVESIRHACSEGQKITLVVAHPSTHSLKAEVVSVNTSIQNQLTSTNQINEGRLPKNNEHNELPL